MRQERRKGRSDAVLGSRGLQAYQRVQKYALGFVRSLYEWVEKLTPLVERAIQEEKGT